MEPAHDDIPSRRSPPQRLALLCHHAWALPALAALSDAGGGAKFVLVQSRLGAPPRDSVRRALDHLIDLGLASPNPGYGHPMRPEYLLTPHGKALGPDCASLLARLATADALAACRRKWMLAAILALATGCDSFGSLQAELADASPRALSQTLRAGASAGLIVRIVSDAYPPSVRYLVTPLAASVGPLLVRIAASLAGVEPGSSGPLRI